ncbi:carboxymuconolactone decarboxylase family protein [Bordetella tumbae]
MAHIDYPPAESLPPPLQEMLRTKGSNVFRMLMHSPRIAPGLLAFAEAVKRENSLPADLAELAILRVGYTCRATYQTSRHERYGRLAGLSGAAIEAARSNKGISSIRSIERTVIFLTDDILANDGLSSEGREQALRTFETGQVSDLVLTVGLYKCVCYFLRSFGIDIETSF